MQFENSRNIFLIVFGFSLTHYCVINGMLLYMFQADKICQVNLGHSSLCWNHPL